MDPVITIRRLVQTPIIIITDDDCVVVIAIMPANPVSRHIMAIIDEAERWPRIVIEWTVATPVEGTR